MKRETFHWAAAIALLGLTACQSPAVPAVAGAIGGAATAVVNANNSANETLQLAAPIAALACTQAPGVHAFNIAVLQAAKAKPDAMANEQQAFEAVEAFCVSPPANTADIIPTALRLIDAFHKAGAPVAEAAAAK